MNQQNKGKKPRVMSTVLPPNHKKDFNDFAKNLLEWRKELLGQEVNKN